MTERLIERGALIFLARLVVSRSSASQLVITTSTSNSRRVQGNFVRDPEYWEWEKEGQVRRQPANVVNVSTQYTRVIGSCWSD